MNQYCSSKTQTIHCDPVLITRAEHRRRPLLPCQNGFVLMCGSYEWNDSVEPVPEAVNSVLSLDLSVRSSLFQTYHC